jgi:hypothetical protein
MLMHQERSKSVDCLHCALGIMRYDMKPSVDLTTLLSVVANHLLCRLVKTLKAKYSK